MTAVAVGRLAGNFPNMPLRATTTLEVFSDDPLSADRLLRRLEVLRQQLSVRWCGSEGAFAGYDRLTMSPRLGETRGTVQLEAVLIPADQASLSVEMYAYGRTVLSSCDAVPEILMEGRGQTLPLR